MRRLFIGFSVLFYVVPACADIASVQWVRSIVQSIQPSQGTQADWNQTITTAADYIKNKPTIPTTAADVGAVAATQSTKGGILTTNASTGEVEVSSRITAGQVSGLATVATTGAYSDLSGTPTLATVATSGDYDDLTNKPTIPAAQVQSDWNATTGMGAILNKPTLATVATSGSYNDLTNKPTIPDAQVQSDWNATTGMGAILNKPTLSAVATSGAYSDLTGTPTLATVATSGSYNDLTNKPTIPDAQVQSDWNATTGMGAILNKPTLATVATTGAYSDLTGTPTLATVATSGDYADLTNKPTIPTVGNATLTIQKNGTTVDTFTANSSTDKTVNITVPTTAAEVGAVPTTTTVNGNALSSNVTLDGADIALSGYTKPNSTSAVVAADTVNAAIGKLEAALDGKQASGSYVPTTTMVNGHALSSNVTVTKSDVGLGNVQNVDQTNAANITSGTIGVARLPVGTTSTTVAAGDDARFDSVPTSQPSGTPPSGRVWIWFN